jgi:hypothetical protein
MMNIKEIASALKPIQISPYELYLDPNNPRFVGKDITIAKDANPLDPKLQERIRAFIEKTFDTNDLWDSISQVGFLTMDRMVVRKYENNKYIVIEGNRRLAAIKTLLAAEEQKEIMIPDNIKKTVTDLEVLLLDLGEEDYREATWFLQGIRHISGIKDWGPYQQAELVHILMQEQNLSFTDAGKAVGAGRKKTGQMLRAYKGLKQMEVDSIYGEKASPELFSHFEQAWAKTSLRNWLDWDENILEYKNKNTFHLFCKWITEDNPETKQSKLTAQEVRDKLSAVIGSDESRKKFINDELKLEAAFGIAIFEKEGFTNWHQAIKNAIDQVNKIPWSYELSEEDIGVLRKLEETITKFLKNKMKE